MSFYNRCYVTLFNNGRSLMRRRRLISISLLSIGYLFIIIKQREMRFAKFKPISINAICTVTTVYIYPNYTVDIYRLQCIIIIIYNVIYSTGDFFVSK